MGGVGVLGWLRGAREQAAALVAGFDPAVVGAGEAAEVVEAAADLERAVGALRVLAAGRAAQGQAWRARGASSPAAWLAAATGTSAAAATAELAAAGRLAGAPGVEAALRAGSLSPAQAAVIAPAASADPAASEQLVAAARSTTLEELRRASRAVQAAAEPARTEDAQARAHAARTLRTWTDADGAWCGRWRLTALAGATVAAALERFHDEAFEAARAAGRRERADALDADALVAMAAASSGADGAATRATIVARVDLAALERGATAPGGGCSIDGIGPVPVSAVRSLVGQAALVALATDGERIVDVRLAGRAMPARLRHAVVARDGGCCVVAGCGATRHLEIHHLEPVGAGGGTHLDGLALLCRWHHDQVTHRGAHLARDPVPPGAPGGWRYTAAPHGEPDDPVGGPFDDDLLDLHPTRPPPCPAPA